jgi:endonuclease/exonuclease/phosphatase family metal-dependent hydrolase
VRQAYQPFHEFLEAEDDNPPNPPESTHLRIATFNVQKFGPNSSQEKAANLAGAIRLSRSQVVVMQEVTPSDTSEHLVDLTRLLNLNESDPGSMWRWAFHKPEQRESMRKTGEGYALVWEEQAVARVLCGGKGARTRAGRAGTGSVVTEHHFTYEQSDTGSQAFREMCRWDDWEQHRADYTFPGENAVREPAYFVLECEGTRLVIGTIHGSDGNDSVRENQLGNVRSLLPGDACDEAGDCVFAVMGDFNSAKGLKAGESYRYARTVVGHGYSSMHTL